jgi:predicted alpha/beta hydrolase family esterase
MSEGVFMPTQTEKLIIPGLRDSGPGHWQTLWCQSRDDCRKVDLGYWDYPSRMVWISRLDRAIAVARSQVVLVAHSLGCHAVAWWAAEASSARLEKVAGALLVAPPDVDREGVDPLLLPFAPTPPVFLPFRSVLVASRDDEYASFERSAGMARTWGSDLVDAGRCGHVNASSGLGDWPEGQHLLSSLDGSARLETGIDPLHARRKMDPSHTR